MFEDFSETLHIELLHFDALISEKMETTFLDYKVKNDAGFNNLQLALQQ